MKTTRGKQPNSLFPDEIIDGGVDGFAKRIDGVTLAIEHTVVEPFEGDIRDQSELVPMFPSIESDTSLIVPGRGINVLRASRNFPR